MGYKRTFDKKYFDFYKWFRKVSSTKKRVKEFKRKNIPYVLTREQEERIKEFYAPYKIPNFIFHNYFTKTSGEFHEDYIPQDIYTGYIDPYFNDIIASKYLENKCYYKAIFSGIPQCETVLMRVNGIWLDGNYKSADGILMDTVLENVGGVFIKEAQTSSGGAGVVFVGKEKLTSQRIMEIANTIPTDLIIQKELKQHPDMARLNDSSVNSLRIYSVLGLDGNTSVYSAVVRMGVDGAKVDNFSAGGVACGIKEDGTLRKHGHNKKGEQLEYHPTSNIKFENYRIPSYCEAIDLVKKAHPMVAHFRSVAWDVAIDEAGSPVLIEANLCRGGIDTLQVNNGPLYGDDTRKILDEVFDSHKK